MAATPEPEKASLSEVNLQLRVNGAETSEDEAWQTEYEALQDKSRAKTGRSWKRLLNQLEEQMKELLKKVKSWEKK